MTCACHVPGTPPDDNSEFAMDVNRDGRPDVVSSGWMRMKGAFWYENPGDKEAVWTSTRIHQALNMEGVIHGDLDLPLGKPDRYAVPVPIVRPRPAGRHGRPGSGCTPSESLRPAAGTAG